jgi:outer membrane protein TolC
VYRSVSMRNASRCCAGSLLATLLVACQHIAPAPLSPERSATALEARSLADPGLQRFLEAETGTRIATGSPARFDLALLTLTALYFQPSLDVARAQLEGARGAVATAAQRPNPTLAIVPEWSANPGTATSPWIAALHFDWPIETAHKREHRAARAEALASAAERAVTVEAWRIRRELRTAVADAVSSEHRVALLRDCNGAQQRLVDRIDHRVQAGAASEADAMLERLALLGTEAELADAERNRAGSRAQVAAVIGVPARALDGIELAYPRGLPSDPLDSLAETDARRQALLERADVLAALDAYAASEASLRLELAKQWPDLHLGSGYQFDQGQSKWGLSVSLDLPVMNQNRGPIAEAVAARSEASARFVALQAQVIAELDQGFAQLRGVRDQVTRCEALVAEQRRAGQRASAARAEGATDRFAELAAEIETQRREIALLDARLALEHARAQLEAAVQGPLALAAAPGESPRALAAGGTR